MAYGIPNRWNPTKIRVLTALLATALFASQTRAGEEKIELDKLPKAVKDAVEKRFPKAKLVEAAKEEDEKKNVAYEVTLKDGETKYDIMLTPEGAITLIEKTIAISDLPKAVSDATAKKYPNAKVTPILPPLSLLTARLLAHRRHARTGHYQPNLGHPLMLRVSARKFPFITTDCRQRTFCKRLPRLAAPETRYGFAPRCPRSIGLALGGEAGARLPERLALPTSVDRSFGE